MLDRRDERRHCAVCTIVLAQFCLCAPYAVGQPPPPPQGHVVIDNVGLQLPGYQGTEEIPADGKTQSQAPTGIGWHIEGGSPPQPPKTDVSWTLVEGEGQFDPSAKEVVLTSNPQGVLDVFYKQPETPSSTDFTVRGRASAGGKSGEDTLQVRGVALEIIEQGPDELYSGTETGKAIKSMYVRAYCPNNSALRPQGTVYANVTGQGVYLKWDEGGTTKWEKTHEMDLAWGAVPGTPPGPWGMLAQFEVAADKPGALPTAPTTAVFSVTLATPNSPVTAQTEVPVLVPLLLEHPEDAGERPVVKKGQCLGGHLVWYADHGKEKYYWGAKGTLKWDIPQGTVNRTYRLNTNPPTVPISYYSPATTAKGPGTRELTEEHGRAGTVDVAVKDNPQDWLQEFLQNWAGWYDVVTEGDFNEMFLIFLASKAF
jgi:hypothetical protein